MPTRYVRDGTSTLIKQVRQLRSWAMREHSGTFYIEGARIVAQALQAGAEIELGVIAWELLSGAYAQDTAAMLQNKAEAILELDATDFQSISFKENLQGIGAVVRVHRNSLDDMVDPSPSGWVALDRVGNPGNLGAIMRTCDAVGCSGLILLGDTVDPYHPAAVRASMGSLFALRLIRASFDIFVEWKKTHGYTIIGTSPMAYRPYHQVLYPTSYVLLMGSERLGLSSRQQSICDLLVRIPMIGTSDSLNLAVATSIVLYEVFSQQYQQQGQ